MKNLFWKGIATSKKQRENAHGQMGPVEMQNLLTCLANLGATHIDVIQWAEDTSWLLSPGGFTFSGPYQTTVEAITQAWYQAIHNTPNIYGPNVFGGYLKVLDRAVFPTTEGDLAGIVDHKNAGTVLSAPTDGRTTWAGTYYNYLHNHVLTANLQTGDILEPFAEFTGSVFSNNWLNGGNYRSLFQVLQTIGQNAATANGATITWMSNPNWTEMNSGFWSGYLDSGINCFDYYGSGPDGRAPTLGASYVQQLLANFNGQNFGDNNNNPVGYGIGTSGYPMSWNEFGDLSGSIHLQGTPVRSGDNFVSGTTQAEQWMQWWLDFFRQLRDGLVNPIPQRLKGYHQWGGWEGQNTSILWKTGSGETSQYFPNWRGQMLANFYINDGMARLPVIRAGAYDSFGGRGQYF